MNERLLSRYCMLCKSGNYHVPKNRNIETFINLLLSHILTSFCFRPSCLHIFLYTELLSSLFKPPCFSPHFPFNLVLMGFSHAARAKKLVSCSLYFGHCLTPLLARYYNGIYVQYTPRPRFLHTPPPPLPGDGRADICDYHDRRYRFLILEAEPRCGGLYRLGISFIGI